MCKKIISILMSVFLIMGCISFTALADEDTGTVNPAITEEENPEEEKEYIPKEPLSVSSGVEALRGQFESGVAPETGCIKSI